MRFEAVELREWCRRADGTEVQRIEGWMGFTASDVMGRCFAVDDDEEVDPCARPAVLAAFRKSESAGTGRERRREIPEEVAAVLRVARSLGNLDMHRFEMETKQRAQWMRTNLLTCARREAESGGGLGIKVVTQGCEVRVVRYAW